MIESEECQKAGCEADLAALWARYDEIAYFDIEGGSFLEMARQTLDRLEEGKTIGAYVALCFLQPDTPLVEVSAATAMLGDDGVFVTVEDEKEALKCAVGMAKST